MYPIESWLVLDVVPVMDVIQGGRRLGSSSRQPCSQFGLQLIRVFLLTCHGPLLGLLLELGVAYPLGDFAAEDRVGAITRVAYILDHLRLGRITVRDVIALTGL